MNTKAEIIDFKKEHNLPGGGDYNGFKIPLLFEMNNDIGLIYYVEDKKTGEYDEHSLLPEPIYINSVFWDKENSCKKYEIVYYHKKFKNTIIVESSKLANTTSIVKSLSSYGIFVNSNNARTLVNYFTNFAKYNRYKFEEKEICNTFGWYESNFVPYSNKHSLYIATKEGIDITDKMSDTLKSKGNFTVWRDFIFSQVKSNNDFRFIMACSFGSPLVKLLYRSFVVHNYGKSEVGKTASQYGALSVWGNPKSLLEDYKSTNTYLEEKAKIYQNILMAIDEKTKSKEKNNSIEDLLYMFANGRSKGKCDKNSNLLMGKTWDNIFLSSAEHKITGKTFSEGSINRLLEIKLKPYLNQKEKASMSYQLLENNHGFAGKLYIDKIIDVGKDEISKTYELINSSLKNDENLTAHIKSISIIVLADYLSNKYVYNNDLTINDSINFGKIYLDKLPKKHDVNTSKQALNYIIEVITANYNKFGIDTGYQERWGFIDSKGNVCIFENIITKLLENEGFYSSTVLSDFKTSGYTLCDNYGITRRVRVPNDVNLGKDRFRMICLKNEVYNDLKENVGDDNSNLNEILNLVDKLSNEDVEEVYLKTLEILGKNKDNELIFNEFDYIKMFYDSKIMYLSSMLDIKKEKDNILILINELTQLQEKTDRNFIINFKNESKDTKLSDLEILKKLIIKKDTQTFQN